MDSRVPIDQVSIWSRARRGFIEFLWVPALIMAGSALFALLVIWLDRSAPGWIQPVRGFFEDYLFRKESSTNSFLGMATTGLITMSSITFSMLLLSLQESASLIGAQVVYSFLMRHRNQLLLGFFLGATLFVLILHAAANEQVNPVLGATLTLVLIASALGALAVLVFTSVNQMRPQTVIGEMRTLTLEARRRQRRLLIATYREPRYRAGTEVRVTTDQHGYIRDIDVDALCEALESRRGEAEIEIRREIGDFVAYGEELALVRAAHPDEAHRLAGRARDAISLDYQRAVERDPSFGVQQILMIGWSSGSTAYHNPGVAMEAIRNLRDLASRWSANYEEVEGSDGTIPLVYPDGLLERVIDSISDIGVVSTESIQPDTFEEVMHTYRQIFPNLPEHLQDRTATSIRRMVTGMADLILTRPLQGSLEALEPILREAGYAETADILRDAREQMLSATGRLGARSTRAQQALPDSQPGSG